MMIYFYDINTKIFQGSLQKEAGVNYKNSTETPPDFYNYPEDLYVYKFMLNTKKWRYFKKNKDSK